MKALAIAAVALLLVAGPAAARVVGNGIELNKIATNGMQLNGITANGVQMNRMASNKLAVNSTLAGGTRRGHRTAGLDRLDRIGRRRTAALIAVERFPRPDAAG